MLRNYLAYIKQKLKKNNAQESLERLIAKIKKLKLYICKRDFDKEK
jgi:hypothetical protein